MSVNIKKFGQLFRSAGNASSSTFISDLFNPLKVYEVGEFCIYDNKLWEKIGTEEMGIVPEEGTSWTLRKVGDVLSEVSGNLAQLTTESFYYTKTMTATANTRMDRYVFSIAKDGYTPISATTSEAGNSDVFSYSVDIGDTTDSGNRNKAVLRVYGVHNASSTKAECRVLVTYIKNK